jgi:hypothetical protein
MSLPEPHDHREPPKTLRVSMPALTAEQADCVFAILANLQDAFFAAYERLLIDLELAATLSPHDDCPGQDDHDSAETDDGYPF